MSYYLESKYNIKFRDDITRTILKELNRHNSIELIGMKRVGIGNYLRFLLNNKDLIKKYNFNPKLIFINVDLNNLIDNQINYFWKLVFKRLYDTTNTIAIRPNTKENISKMFTKNIQHNDLLIILENIRDILTLVIKEDFYPVFFFIRFDKMEKVFDSKFFDHLQGLKTTCAYKLSYVFTSYKKLYDLNSKIFDRNTLTSFSSKIYFKPAKPIDAQVILKMFLKKYKLNISDSLIDSIITLSGGHTHIMLILVIILSELDSKKISNEEEIKKIFLHDERFKLQADELIAHLNKKEIEIVKNIIINPKIKIETDNYLRQSGFITLTNEDEYRIFSPLLRQYLSEHYFKVIINNNHKFTHKENLLFSLLLQNIDQVVEREDIMENVWPEQETYEISDWSLDKLISRLRNKLKIQNSNFQLNTIKTRGFMLSKKS